jgi:hypothetical protein
MNSCKLKSSLSALLLITSISFSLPAIADSKEKTTSSAMIEKEVSLTTESSTPHISEILPEDFRPAFTRETTIKLNAIVKRSYSVINEFDTATKEWETYLSGMDQPASTEATNRFNKDQLMVLKTLNKRSKDVLTEMNRAVDTLKASGEHYNTAVLAGMVKFVKTVDQEVSEELVLVFKSI